MNFKTHFLYPSALHASKEPHIINTILGSCVAVCLYDPVLKIGGMNHFMLPLWNGEGLASPKYGNIAIPKLIEKLLQYGSNEKHLKAKIFGGANIFESNLEQFQIGDRNIKVAEEVLKEHNIPVVSCSVGGSNGRRIQFNTQSGAVGQKIIEKRSQDEEAVKQMACKAQAG
jgi:chemotaxis protein CheD